MRKELGSQILVVDSDEKVRKAFASLFQDRFQVSTFADTEAALSWLKDNQDVSVIVSALDREGKPITVESDDFLAIVMQHEIDHLNGILFIDKADKLVTHNS